MRNWQTVGGCVQGASHIRNAKPCQDALRIDNKLPLHIISLSDGHGSAACPYSDEGAKVAVDTAFFVFSSIFKGKDPYHTISTNKDIWLPKQIEQHWKNTIKGLHQVKGRDLPPDGEEFPYELYGATLLTMVLTDDFVFALQLGDGDILSIEELDEFEDSQNVLNENARNKNAEDENFEETRKFHIDWVIPPDDSLGPETNSLCQTDCWQHMKTRIIHLEPGKRSPVFLLSTDGYANSFYNNDGFKKAGADFYKLWHDEGKDYIESNIGGWLSESSAQGSGDDITLAIVVEEVK